MALKLGVSLDSDLKDTLDGSKVCVTQAAVLNTSDA